MLTCMNDIWSAILKEVCPGLTGPRRKLFFDLADPEKRTRADILQALSLITQFEKHFDVILGLNEKEAYEIGDHLGFNISEHSPEGLLKLATQIREHIAVNTVVVHPVSFALAVSAGDSAIVEGPFTPKPLITTGAGDHFNAGFCLGKLLGFDNAHSVLTGVTTSGFYVRIGEESRPSRTWPAWLAKAMADPMILPVVKYGHPVLRQKGARIETRHARDQAAHRGHVRDDVRQQRHRPRGATGRPGVAIDRPRFARGHRPALDARTQWQARGRRATSCRSC